ncbi:hypothetical protein [Siculibacillus lacustris]|nr:hypothetical protein [Siculibacillus lacustris]
MTEWIARLCATPLAARPTADHREVFARFVDRLAARLPRPERSVSREV